MQVIEWHEGKVRFLDQTLLPSEEQYVETDDPERIAKAIKCLAIRGAPLIGIAAAYGLALAFQNPPAPNQRQAHLARNIALFASTRPTAVNLFWALNRMKVIAEQHAGSTGDVVQAALLTEALAIHQEDKTMCERISEYGAEILPNAAVVVTHCNTGALATGGQGTALGAIRRAWERKKLKHVYVDETRPLHQGSRLTAWELGRLKIPHTLITDSTAGFLMQQGRVSAVMGGADRIAANGDVANKVGTYALAVLAHHHEIPFFVAAPSSTIDFDTRDGKAIPVEERSRHEILEANGRMMAPADTEVYSPAFDITPHDLVTAIVTERGVVQAPFQVTLCGLKQSSDTRMEHSA